MSEPMKWSSLQYKYTKDCLCVDDEYDVERIIKDKLLGFAASVYFLSVETVVSLIKFSSDITWDLMRKKTSYVCV